MSHNLGMFCGVQIQKYFFGIDCIPNCPYQKLPKAGELIALYLQVLLCNNRRLIDPLSISDCPVVLRGQDNLITVQVQALFTVNNICIRGMCLFDLGSKVSQLSVPTSKANQQEA